MASISLANLLNHFKRDDEEKRYFRAPHIRGFDRISGLYTYLTPIIRTVTLSP
jgi:hypothetical protein